MIPQKVDTKTCLVCGDEFCKKSSESRKYWNTKKYCSNKCSLVFTSVKGSPFKGEHLSNEHKNKISQSSKGQRRSKITEFKKGQVSLRKGRKFPEFSGENHPNWKPKTEKECEVCGTKVLLPPWKVKRFRFCGRDCWAKGTRGADSPVYKGANAKTPLRVRIMELPEYKEWHSAVLKRDNYLCVLCKAPQPLEVDHIKRFIHVIKDITTIEEARECKELWDIKNGRTLCRSCHRKTDTYGTTGLKKHY